MNRSRWSFTGLAVLITAMGMAQWGSGLSTGYGQSNEKDLPKNNVARANPGALGPVARVQTVPLQRSGIEESIIAYGIVMPLQDEIQTFSVTFECLIDQVLVNDGQVIEVNDPLLRIIPSPDTALGLEKARNELKVAKIGLNLIRERIKLKLAIQQDLVAARQRLELAKGNLQSLERRGIEGPSTIRAAFPGIVYQVNVQQGQIVPAGANMLQTASQDKVIVQLNIESEDIPHVRKGQLVRLKMIHAVLPQPIEGRVLTITRKVDPRTRLVNVLVQPVQDHDLLLNDYVEGEIVVTSRKTLVAPRNAVLPEEGRYHVFTIQDGRAVKHIVGIGLENSNEIEILSEELNEGDPIVVLGNYELTDGMAVRVEEKK